MRICCIVPFYNESERIIPIISCLKRCFFIQEIVLVDDGSNDGGVAEEILSDKFKILVKTRNEGKYAALRDGFRQSTGDLVIFLDADLKNLSVKHLRSLADPILDNTHDLTISGREYNPMLNILNGERAFLRSKFNNLFDKELLTGYTFEIAMNNFALVKGYRLMIVKTPNLRQTYKVEKQGFLNGIRGEVKSLYLTVRKFGLIKYILTFGLTWKRLLLKNNSYSFFWIKILLRGSN